MQRLLEEGCDPLAQILLENGQALFDEAIFHKYDNALKQAAANGHVSIVQLLLDFIHAENPSKLRPSIIDIIPIAAENNAVQLLQDILDNKMTRQLNPVVLANCLSEALSSTAPYEEATRLLLNHGANPVQGGYGGFHFVSQVVKQGSPSCVKMLLEKTGLNPLRPFPFEPGSHYLTNLLEVATTYRDLEMVKQLLEANDVDLNPANEECQLALSSALSWRRLDFHKTVEIIKYFLDHGFDVNCNARRGDKEAPLLTTAASMTRGSDMILNFLLSYGANVDMAGDFQRTALWEASKLWYHARITALLDHGADPLRKDSKGQTPLDASMSDFRGIPLKIILRAIEDKGIQVYLTSLGQKAERAYCYEDRENRLLKYLIQHQCRVMYPCA